MKPSKIIIYSLWVWARWRLKWRAVIHEVKQNIHCCFLLQPVNNTVMHDPPTGFSLHYFCWWMNRARNEETLLKQNSEPLPLGCCHVTAVQSADQSVNQEPGQCRSYSLFFFVLTRLAGHLDGFYGENNCCSPLIRRSHTCFKLKLIVLCSRFIT